MIYSPTAVRRGVTGDPWQEVGSEVESEGRGIYFEIQSVSSMTNLDTLSRRQKVSKGNRETIDFAPESHFRNCGIERRCVCTQMVRGRSENIQSYRSLVAEKQSASRGVNFCG